MTLAYVLAVIALGRISEHKQRGKRVRRNAHLPTEVAEVRSVRRSSRPIESRVLNSDQIGMLRYALDSALQPLDEVNGFDVIEQFQSSSLRYQFSQLGYTIAGAQRHYTPNFHGYLNEAQRRVIDKQLLKMSWDVVRLEKAWGQFSTDFDPVKKVGVNITAYINLNVLQYINNTGDMRYAKPGGLTFIYDEQRKFCHDVHTVEGSLIDNYRG